MTTRAAHVEQVAAELGHVPEIADLVRTHRAVVERARRVVFFNANAFHAPGRLGELLDDLAHVLEPAPTPENPADWDAVEWRRRCADAGVTQAALLRRAVDLANDEAVDRPHSFHDIPREIAAQLADGLVTLEGSTTA